MAITGNLRTMQLSELLQWLSMGQKTGTLVVRGTAGEKRIYFQAGKIISSSSTIEREYLGHFLVAFGYISEEELTKAMQVQEESRILLGKILVTIGAITEEDLTDLIKLKAAETIYDIFLWTEGAFEFVDGEIQKMPMVPIQADVTGIVMEGLRRYDEWQRIRTKIKSSREIPMLLVLVDAEQLPDRERLVLNAIDGSRSIDEIANLTHNPEFHVAKFLFDLLDSGHAKIIGEKSGHAPSYGGPDFGTEITDEDPLGAVFEDALTSPFDMEAEPEAQEVEEEPQRPPTPAYVPPAPQRPPAPAYVASAPPQPVYAPRGYMSSPSPLPQPSFIPPPAVAARPAPPEPPPPLDVAWAPEPPPRLPSTPVPIPIPAPVPAPEAPPRAPTKTGVAADFSRFLKRGPDSDSGRRPPSTSSTQIPVMRATPAAVATAPVATAPAPRPAAPAASRADDVARTPSTSLIPSSAVPTLMKPMEELMNWSFTPNEAFIVSRINGMWDVKSIAKISPFPEIEVLRVFQKLHAGGVIAWR